MHIALSRTDHRPWPLPASPWAGRQSWCDLLFAHWPISAELLRPLVPKELKIQEFEGTSWIGIVPFRMKGVMARGLPDLPWISAFPELNVRVYVEYEGKPGVWFLSLDATNSLAVVTARTLFHLPYYWSKMSLGYENDSVVYSSERKFHRLRFKARYKSISEPYESKKGTLEHWLTERYCLYAKSGRGSLYRLEIHHHPWLLQKAEAEISENDLLNPYGLKVAGNPILHFSKKIDVIGWWPQKVLA